MLWLGTSLCTKAPIKRTSVQNSHGDAPPNGCSGSFSIDFNAFTQAGSDAKLVAGATVDGQWWSRDSSDPFTTEP